MPENRLQRTRDAYQSMNYQFGDAKYLLVKRYNVTSELPRRIAVMRMVDGEHSEEAPGYGAGV